MKRFLAVLLVLVMVLPMCVFANAAETKAEVKPFMISTPRIWEQILIISGPRSNSGAAHLISISLTTA